MGNMGKTASTAARNGAIDFWKFLFSVLIVQFHSSNMVADGSVPFEGGAIAVEFFFLVSGYLMAASIMRRDEASIVIGRDSRKFLFHKIQGLCPEFLIAWGIGFIVQHIAKEQVTKGSLIQDFMTGIWELFFLRESGLTGFISNPAAWYISAMLLAMLVLVPLFFKNRDLFINVWAPVIAIATLGYLCKNLGNLREPTSWLGFTYKGVVRAFGELCLGTICWAVCCGLRKVRLSALGRLLVTLVELGCYLLVIAWSYSHRGSKMDFVMLLLFAVGVIMTFSSQSLLSSVFNKPVVYFLGKISFPIFLSHNYWSHALPRIFPGQAYAQLYPKYLAATVLTTVVIYWTAKGIRAVLPGFLALCKKLLLQED
ncbi:MAG: acyltransferase [Eubacterium sp.]|nr:acyltransferase [Eubacterium sp.]